MIIFLLVNLLDLVSIGPKRTFGLDCKGFSLLCLFHNSGVNYIKKSHACLGMSMKKCLQFQLMPEAEKNSKRNFATKVVLLGLLLLLLPLA